MAAFLPLPSPSPAPGGTDLEEGLEQDFNSLDAQREACAAYIVSQKHEGWTQLPSRYDDGGFSGGSLQRPGLEAYSTISKQGASM